LAGLVVGVLNQLVDGFEFVVDLLQEGAVLVVEEFFVFFHLDVGVADAVQFLFEYAEVVFVVAGDVGDGVFAGDDAVVFVDG
jgi:hypothetical protein